MRNNSYLIYFCLKMWIEWVIWGETGFFCFVFFFFFLQNKPILGNCVGWLWGLGWVLNTWFNRKFSEEQFSTLVFFHKNAYSMRYLQKTVFCGRGCQIPILKKQLADIVGFLVCFFGHQSTPLSAIKPLPAQFALFFLTCLH